MRVLEHTIAVPGRSSRVLITPLADVHVGTVFCDEALFRRWVRWIADDPWHFWIGLGDMAELINRRDPRHREDWNARWLWGKADVAQAQIEFLLDHLAPIRDRCLGLLRGNHEEEMLRVYERDVYYDLVQGLKVHPDQRLALGMEGFLRLRFIREGIPKDAQVFDFYLHHGYGGGRLPGADALALGRLATSFDFDVALLGHRHRVLCFEGVRKGLATGGRGRLRIVTRDWRAALCGSFRNEYLEGVEVEGYAVRKGYPPTATGPITVQVEVFHGQDSERHLRVIL